MTEEEDFQFVVSREDYEGMKNAQKTLQDLKHQNQKLLEQNSANQQESHSQISSLKNQLNCFHGSMKSYADKQAKAVEGLIRMLSSRKNFKSLPGLDLSKFMSGLRQQIDTIKGESQNRIYGIENLNNQIRSLLDASLKELDSDIEKLQEYKQKYSDSLDEANQLHQKCRSMTEKIVFLEKEKAQKISLLQKCEKQLQSARQEAQLSKKDQNILKKDLNQLTDKVQKLSKASAASEKNSKALNNEVSDLKKVYEDSKKQLNLKNKQNEKLKKQLSEIQEKTSSQNAQIALENQNLKKTLQQVQTLNDQLTTKVDHLSQSVDDLNQSTHNDKNVIEAKNNEIDDLKVALNVFLNKNVKTQNQSQIIKNLTTERDKLRKDMMMLKEELETQLQNLAGLQQENKILKQSQKGFSQSLKKDHQALQEKFLKKQNELLVKDQQKLAESARLHQELDRCSEKITVLEGRCHDLERTVEMSKAEVEGYKEELRLKDLNCQKLSQEAADNKDICLHLERQCKQLEQRLQKAESVDPSSIVRRSSISKGEKSYYVKEMIVEYGNEMKKNLFEIGALSHQEIKEMVVSELRLLGQFVKEIEQNYE